MAKKPGQDLPAGLYEALLTRGLDAALRALDGDDPRAFTEPLDPEEAPRFLARHLGAVLERALAALPEERRPGLCDAVLTAIRAAAPSVDQDREEDVARAELLMALARPRGPLAADAAPPRPLIPLSSSDLLINDPKEPGVGHNLKREIASADSVDLICAFIRWQGLRLLEDELREFARGGGRLRVITTTYMGATEAKALDALDALGAEVKVSYESRVTRLHAKAWLFSRRSAYDTAYIGSSNLSRSALVDGLEWNVRLSRVETPSILEKFRGAFESYWQDEAFEDYDAERFRQALAIRASKATETFVLDVHPHPHQRRILERLDAERQRHKLWRNLIVAATGTGKTVVAALDYRRLRREWGEASLLFVAHRKEILEQALRVFRAVLKDGAFGELFVGGERPTTGRHVFASVQSLSRLGERPRDAAFDVVVIDEAHHVGAETYRWLLEGLAPRLLLGLTATPERSDGVDIRRWFGGRMTVELRLWDALERGLLCPFQYFGVHDEVDLSGLKWTRGGYPIGELTKLYTASDARVRLVLEALRRRVADPKAMTALGFCVSIDHAGFMADRFNAAGIPARSLSAKSSKEQRRSVLAALRRGEVAIVFAVDLFNEGLDIPEIDTVLLLRPTESATVFLQQLGRGLRWAEGKALLTVLDFIGQQHARFRFDLRYRALTGASRAEVGGQIAEGFPCLPAGCAIQLDRVARRLILDNIKRALGARFAPLVDELKACGEGCALADFLERSGLEPEALYKTRGWSWSRLRREAGFSLPPPGPDEQRLTGALGRLLHIDDPERIAFYDAGLARPAPPAPAAMTLVERRRWLMLNFALWGSRSKALSLADGLERLWRHPAIRAELRELLAVLGAASPMLPRPLSDIQAGVAAVPLSVHARYSLEEALAAFGLLTPEKPHPIREGVKHDKAARRDLLFVTLKKTEKQYSPSTLYRDYPISPSLFHWESQSTTGAGSPTGRRYVEHQERGNPVFLFMRRAKKAGGRTLPYAFLGPVRYVEHSGSKPMAITWKLAIPMPDALYSEARLAAG